MLQVQSNCRVLSLEVRGKQESRGRSSRCEDGSEHGISRMPPCWLHGEGRGSSPGKQVLLEAGKGEEWTVPCGHGDFYSFMSLSCGNLSQSQ
jgi:hypothetical protein